MQLLRCLRTTIAVVLFLSEATQLQPSFGLLGERRRLHGALEYSSRASGRVALDWRPFAIGGPVRPHLLHLPKAGTALIQRYPATTILALLQEIAHLPPTAKIDFDQIIAKTTTGITNPREYQMLWRHLAYREPLPDKLDDGARPVDVDSDYEYEVEAAPSTDEVAACVKFLMTSGFPMTESSHLNCATLKDPSTINIPVATGKTGKQTIMAAAKAEDDGDANIMAPRRKRKRWSEEEDSALISAVDKYGEGNWTEIVKANIIGEITASQLSLRYRTLKKRLKLGLGGGTPSDQKQNLLRVRANQAMTHALDNTNANSKCGVTNRMHNSWMQTTTTAEDLDARKPNRMRSLGPTTKGRVTSKKTLTKSNMDADSLAAVAVAAGARIVSDLDAELFKAAPQGKNTINICLPPPVSLKAVSQTSLNIETSRKNNGVKSSPCAEVLPKPVQSECNDKIVKGEERQGCTGIGGSH